MFDLGPPHPEKIKHHPVEFLSQCMLKPKSRCTFGAELLLVVTFRMVEFLLLYVSYHCSTSGIHLISKMLLQLSSFELCLTLSDTSSGDIFPEGCLPRQSLDVRFDREDIADINRAKNAAG